MEAEEKVEDKKSDKNEFDGLEKKVGWYSKIDNSISLISPNENLSNSYLQKVKSSLATAELNIENSDILWGTVIIYYAEYYALYSFLQKIGIKCENHAFSIHTVSFLIGTEKTDIINKHKQRRLDAQYYIKTQSEDEIKKMLVDAKQFVSEFDNIISNLTEKEISSYREKINTTLDENKTK